MGANIVLRRVPSDVLETCAHQMVRRMGLDIQSIRRPSERSVLVRAWKVSPQETIPYAILFCGSGVASAGAFTPLVETRAKGKIAISDEFDPEAREAGEKRGIYLVDGSMLTRMVYEMRLVHLFKDYLDETVVDPSDLKRSLEWAMEVYARGDLEKAERMFTRILAMDEDHIDTRYYRARCLLDMERYDDALGDIERILALDRENLDALVLRAHIHNLQHDTEAEIETYQRILRTHPKDVDSWVNLGVAYAENGDDLQAVTCLRNATKADGSSALAWNNLGMILRRLNDLEGAREAFLRLTSLTPGDETAWTILVATEVEAGMLKDAREHSRSLEALPPRTVEGLLTLALVYRSTGDDKRMSTHLQKAREVSPMADDVWRSLISAQGVAPGPEPESPAPEDNAGVPEPTPASAGEVVGVSGPPEGAGEKGEAGPPETGDAVVAEVPEEDKAPAAPPEEGAYGPPGDEKVDVHPSAQAGVPVPEEDEGPAAPPEEGAYGPPEDEKVDVHPSVQAGVPVPEEDEAPAGVGEGSETIPASDDVPLTSPEPDDGMGQGRSSDVPERVPEDEGAAPGAAGPSGAPPADHDALLDAILGEGRGASPPEEGTLEERGEGGPSSGSEEVVREGLAPEGEGVDDILGDLLGGPGAEDVGAQAGEADTEPDAVKEAPGEVDIQDILAEADSPPGDAGDAVEEGVGAGGGPVAPPPGTGGGVDDILDMLLEGGEGGGGEAAPEGGPPPAGAGGRAGPGEDIPGEVSQEAGVPQHPEAPPGEHDPRLDAARLLFALGEHDDALMLIADVKGEDAALLRSSLQMAKRDVRGAYTSLEKVKGRGHEALLGRVNAHILMNAPGSALRELESYPPSRERTLIEVHCLTEMGRYDDALQRLGDLGGGVPMWRALRGLILHKAERLDEAVEEYTHAVEDDPTIFFAWHNLGIIYTHQGLIDDAETCFENAQEIWQGYRPSAGE